MWKLSLTRTPNPIRPTTWGPFSSSSRMRVIYHNWSATKQRPHPQSVAEISHHSVLSGDRIRPDPNRPTTRAFLKTCNNEHSLHAWSCGRRVVQSYIHARLWQLTCAVVCEVVRSGFTDTGNLAMSTEVKFFTKETSWIAPLSGRCLTLTISWTFSLI